MAVTKKRYNLTSVQISMMINGQTYVIGSAESAEVFVTQTTSTAHQANSKMPAEIVDGIISIKGKVSRAQIDFQPHNLLINKDGENPEFQIYAYEKIQGKQIAVFNCKITGDIGTSIALDGWAKDDFSFEARDYDFIEPSA